MLTDYHQYVAYLGGGYTTEEALTEAALIGKAVQETKREIGALSFGYAMQMSEDDIMRRACRNLIKVQKEASGQDS